MEERIIELESRVAFQEEGIQSLGETLRQQQQIIETLQLDIEELRQRLKSAAISPLDGKAVEPPPPHY